MSPIIDTGEVATSDTSPALDEFQGVNCSALRRIFYQLLPLGFMAGIILDGLWQGFSMDVLVYATLIAAILLTLWFFKGMMEDIPIAMNLLWCRGILAENCNSKESAPEKDACQRASLKEYKCFMEDFEKSLNNCWGQIIFAAVFAMALLCRSAYEISLWLGEDLSHALLFNAGGLETRFWATYMYVNYYVISVISLKPMRFFTGFFVEPFIGIFLGLIAWRMLVTGLQISRLDRCFDLTPRLKDPDKCGGLEPLGNLCLHNAKIVGVWGLFLGLWIILGTSYQMYSLYVPLFYKLLALPFSLALASFFLPLWGVHCAMLDKKNDLGVALDHIAGNIDALARKRLEAAQKIDKLETDNLQISKWLAEQDVLQKIYEDSLNFAVWPFNYRIMLVFLTSQAVPLLGLTGLGGPLVVLLKSMMDFLGNIN